MTVQMGMMMGQQTKCQLKLVSQSPTRPLRETFSLVSRTTWIFLSRFDPSVSEKIISFMLLLQPVVVRPHRSLRIVACSFSTLGRCCFGKLCSIPNDFARPPIQCVGQTAQDSQEIVNETDYYGYVLLLLQTNAWACTILSLPFG